MLTPVNGEKMIRLILKICSLLTSHPLTRSSPMAAYWRFIRWQIASRLSPAGIVVPFVDGTVLVVKSGEAGATGNVYVGLMEFEDMSFVLHLLDSGDLFGDIGANVGVYTILAAGVRGSDVVAVEPIPSTLVSLRRNISINNVGSLVAVVPAGVGEQRGTLAFTDQQNATNHVVASGTGIEIPIETLDAIFLDRTPVLIKIDVEGFETSALNGGQRILEDPNLKAIIIELNGLGARYGFNDREIDVMLTGLGFLKYTYSPFRRLLKLSDSIGRHDTLYIRDLEFVNSRLKLAEPFCVLGVMI